MRGTGLNLDEKDMAMLRSLQADSKPSVKDVANRLNMPVTTVHSKVKRLEKEGVIKGYRAILDERKLQLGATAFVQATFSYRLAGEEKVLSQRDVAREVARFSEVQEVHIISGDWDLLIKVKSRDVDAIGRFIVDKLRTVKGIEKTVTCMVFDTAKETTEIPI
jgi:DNA-binding Lrp family transcriptional regulator